MQTLRVSEQAGTLRVTLARPHVKNAFDLTLVKELGEILAWLPQTARCIVLDAEGDTFCAGADLTWMKASATQSTEKNFADARAMQALFTALDECPLPVVARVQGAALGGGTGLAACCDVVIASQTAVFALSEVRLGLVPAVISPFVLPKVGVAAARRYFLTGERFTAEVALRLGLVHEVVAPAELDAAVARVLAALEASGPNAVRTAKRLIRDVSGRTPREVAEPTAELIANVRASAEGVEGLSAFLEKRKPSWA